MFLFADLNIGFFFFPNYLFYLLPSRFKTTSIVLKIIFISSLNDHSSIYFKSSFTTSSKSNIVLRPLVCHIPVIHGFPCIHLKWCSSYFLYSSYVGGLVPTTLISPFRTLINCGSSSRDQSRSFCPNGKILGSLSILNIKSDAS